MILKVKDHFGNELRVVKEHVVYWCSLQKNTTTVHLIDKTTLNLYMTIEEFDKIYSGAPAIEPLRKSEDENVKRYAETYGKTMPLKTPIVGPNDFEW